MSEKQIRVLVVEDNPDDHALLHRELKKTPIGDHVLFFTDPRAALDLLQGPDGDKIRQELVAIILDVNLPYLSGIDVLKIIRSIEGMCDFPIVVMTSAPHPEVIEECRKLRVSAFMEKPVRFQNFSMVIASLFHRSVSAV